MNRNPRYGWRRSLPDFRDRRYLLPPHLLSMSMLPPAVDLRKNCPPVMDQGPLGSCVANAVTAILRCDRINQGLPDVELSRLQLYYDGRKLENAVNDDTGLEIRDAIKVAATIGVAHEHDWPYDIKRFKEQPSEVAYKEAILNKALEYRAVNQSVHELKAALATGHPIAFGIAVYDSFETKEVEKTGIIPMPTHQQTMRGGHCMYLCAYDDVHDSSHAIGRNSYGVDWGNKGDFSIPWSYLTNTSLSGDFWCITNVGTGQVAA